MRNELQLSFPLTLRGIRFDLEECSLHKKLCLNQVNNILFFPIWKDRIDEA
jgi:hypothetical protein